jgi:hypothetical protein
VLVRVTDGQGLGARARADGLDIVFENVAHELLLFEIERWDQATGALVAWVALPMLDGAADTVIYLVYGDGMALDRSDANATFGSTFRHVWHLAQDPGPGAAGDIEDSTQRAHATAHASMASANLVDAVAGKGIVFDGNDDELSFTNGLSGTTPHTISAWVDQSANTTNGADTLISFGGASGNRNRFVWTDDTNSMRVGFYSNDFDTSTRIASAGWKYFTWTYDGSTSTVRTNDGTPANGGSTDSAAHSGANTNATQGKIGNSTWAAWPFEGRLDELRVATVARSQAWIATEYNNQRPGSTFMSLGPEEAR